MFMLDINAVTEPLIFGEGKDAFSLKLKPISGQLRMAILDAARGGSFCEIQEAVGRLILGWEGVCGPDGNPLPFQYVENDIKKNRFDELLGAVGCEMQIRILSGIMAFVGIPTADIDEIAEVFSKSKTGIDTAPTAPPDDAMLTNASGG